MRPQTWNPPIALSLLEQKVHKRIKKAKLFSFLREHRHEIFNEEFQQEMSALFKDSTVGHQPIFPAQCALATILQAYMNISDDELIEALVMDRRWQLVLDCLDCEKGPFSKGTLVRFRAVLIAKDFDRRLVERTIEIAKEKEGFNYKNLRGALDSSPLWGAARVEDTYNLLGHALRKALNLIATDLEQTLETVAAESGSEILARSSLKAALDLDWDDPNARVQALSKILSVLNAVEFKLQQTPELKPETVEGVNENISIAREIQQQDVEETSEGNPKLKKGVAKDRRISIEDKEMRHGRKNKSMKINGYKRHVLTDLDSGLVFAVGVTPANVPEATVTDDIEADLTAQSVTLKELHIDRAYLSSNLVKNRDESLMIICKAWPVRNGKYFNKQAFTLDWEQQLIHCPNQMSIPFTPGKAAHFPVSICADCPLKEQCTNSKTGRSISIHADERLLDELRQRQATPLGRAKLRERVQVEHTLAHIGRWQGDQARYLGQRKNLFDLRRLAVVHNLHVLARMSVFTNREPDIQIV
jgi:hypothetical protein